MRKVFVVGGGLDYEHMFMNNGWAIAYTPEEADLIQFTGGSDVHPSFYGEEVHPQTRSSIERDKREARLFHELAGIIPMAGICRGGQFLNVMCGGRMFQHVDGHATGMQHEMITDDGRSILVTSTHHQMMRPGLGGLILGKSYESTFKEHVDEDVVRTIPTHSPDVEIVYYPDDIVLCFQPHPEYLGAESDCQKYYFELINRFLFGELPQEEDTTQYV